MSIVVVPLKVMPTGRPTRLANAAIEILPVITDNVNSSVTTIPVIVLNHFIFFASRSQTSISSRKNALISVNFFKWYVCGSFVAVGFKSG